MELAAQLGKAIKENEVYKKFLEAKEAYDHNDELNRKIMEYGVTRKKSIEISNKIFFKLFMCPFYRTFILI